MATNEIDRLKAGMAALEAQRAIFGDSVVETMLGPLRAALAIQAAIIHFCRTRGAKLAMRIGVNTGPVVLGAVGTTGEFTAMGDTVNLASRLEHAAPVGGVLIGHDTYRHVRGRLRSGRSRRSIITNHEQ